jgi:hypothetical protein
MSSQMQELNPNEKVQKILEIAPKLTFERRMKVLTLINILSPNYITEQADGSRINLDRLPEIQINRIYDMVIRYSKIDSNDLI